MTDIQSRSKGIKKSRFPVDLEAEKRFDGLKRKYANAVAYLLVKNVRRSDLQSYFAESEENIRRFATLKRFRQQIIDSRPKAKMWVDKPFYLKLDIGTTVVQEDGSVKIPILMGDCIFRQTTNVVSSRKELELYLETIAMIIDSEKVWADPDMADFDIGEREYLSEKVPEKQTKSSAPVSDSDLLKLEE